MRGAAAWQSRPRTERLARRTGEEGRGAPAAGATAQMRFEARRTGEEGRGAPAGRRQGAEGAGMEGARPHARRHAASAAMS